MRVSIGGTDWAEIMPVDQLRRADRKAVNAVIVFEQGTGGPIIHASMDDDIATALLSRVCTDWSLPYPAPVLEPASLDRLTLEQDAELRKAIAEHVKAITGSTAPVPENQVPTPGSVSLSGTSRGSLMTRKWCPGKCWAMRLMRKRWAGLRSRSTCSPSSRTTGLCRSSMRSTRNAPYKEESRRG